mgnify:CR=1 FL=1
MKTYLCTASCLVDDIVLKHYVRAKNERQAWLKGYVYFNYHCSVADGGTVDVKRVKDFSNMKGVQVYESNI